MNRGIHLKLAAALSNDWGPLLRDIDRAVLKKLISASVKQMRQTG